MSERKILVVDDEVPIRELLSEAFAQEGYKTITAAGGAEALKILDDESIQVLFLDLNMPGMNGIELCRIIREKNPVAVIYAMTGYSTLFTLVECRQAGFDDYFTKPIRLDMAYQAASDAFEKLDRWRKLDNF